MRKAGILLLCALGALARAPGALASFSQDEAGTTSAQILKLGADARAAAMGQAVRAFADDATAVYWNPAGLAALKQHHVHFSHGAHVQGVFQDFLAYAQPLESVGQGRPRQLRESQMGSIGLAFSYLNAGSLGEVDNTGAPTGERFTPQEFVGTVAWGGSVSSYVDLGLGLKYIYSKVYDSAQSAAGDLGARLRLRPFGMPLTIAVSIQNFGKSMRYGDRSEALPLTMGAAASLRVLKGLAINVDMIAPNDNSVHAAVGVEYRTAIAPYTGLAVRAGYNGMNYYQQATGISTVTLGAGLRLRMFDVDYAWTPFGTLHNAHRFSLGYRF